MLPLYLTISSARNYMVIDFCDASNVNCTNRMAAMMLTKKKWMLSMMEKYVYCNYFDMFDGCKLNWLL